MSNKICPLLITGPLLIAGPDVCGAFCQEARCAWYDDETGECAIKSLGRLGRAVRASRGSLDSERYFARIRTEEVTG